MKQLKRLWRDQRGQSLVLYAAAIFVTVVLVVGGLEIGVWNLQYYRAQQAADLAALSAAQYVPLSYEEESDTYGGVNAITKTRSTAFSVFDENNGELYGTESVNLRYGRRSTAITPAWNTVEVSEERNFTWIIIDMLTGSEEPRYEVSVESVAKAEALTVPYAAVPLALIKKKTVRLPYDRPGEIITGSLTNPSLVGTAVFSLGILDITKGTTMSPTNALGWLTYDYTGDMKVAKETAPWHKDVTVADAVRALDARITNGEEEMILPVISIPTGSSVPTETVTIDGYACFQLSSVRSTGTNLSITGKFIKYIDTESDRKPDDKPNYAEYYGVRVIYSDK